MNGGIIEIVAVIVFNLLLFRSDFLSYLLSEIRELFVGEILVKLVPAKLFFDRHGIALP